MGKWAAIAVLVPAWALIVLVWVEMLRARRARNRVEWMPTEPVPHGSGQIVSIGGEWAVYDASGVLVDASDGYVGPAHLPPHPQAITTDPPEDQQ